MNRISIIGTTGSGKTTLAKAIAKRLALPFTELDAISEHHEKPTNGCRLWNSNYSGRMILVLTRAGCTPQDRSLGIDCPFYIVVSNVFAKSPASSYEFTYGISSFCWATPPTEEAKPFEPTTRCLIFKS